MNKISAFTIIKNAVRFSYPIVESINSAIDYVDEYIVNVGIDSEDSTLKLLYDNFLDNDKVKIIENKWGGKEFGTRFMSIQTNLALSACSNPYVLYLQADECLKDGQDLDKWIEEIKSKDVQGITFQYKHFIKDPFHIRKTYSDGYDCYEKELRLFKNNGRLKSYGDAQSFAFEEDLYDRRGPQPALRHDKLFIDSTLEIFHYGYLKDRKKLLDKKKYLDEFYRISEPNRKEKIEEDINGYKIYEDSIKEWAGEHPKSMAKTLGLS